MQYIAQWEQILAENMMGEIRRPTFVRGSGLMKKHLFLDDRAKKRVFQATWTWELRYEGRIIYLFIYLFFLLLKVPGMNRKPYWLPGHQDEPLIYPVSRNITRFWLYLLKINFSKSDNYLGHWNKWELVIPDQQFAKI